MGLFGNFFKSTFEKWVESASDEELSDGYEERRLQWLKDGQCGTGEKTPEMEMISHKISERSAVKWENDPCRSKDPYFRWTDESRWDKD